MEYVEQEYVHRTVYVHSAPTKYLFPGVWSLASKRESDADI